MPHVYRMTRPRNFLQTMRFATYNAAIQFCSKSGLLNPTKPYKRMMHVNGEYMPVWCVTLAYQANKETATFEKLAA